MLLAVALATGCDREAPTPVATRTAAVLPACAEPTLADPVECDTPLVHGDPFIDAIVDLALPDVPHLRSADAMTRSGPDDVVVAGTHGATETTGVWLASFNYAGKLSWSASVPGSNDITHVLAAGDDVGVWAVAAEADDRAVALHFDLAGALLGTAVLPGFAVESILNQADGALALVGNGGQAFVGLAADGSQLWNGNDDQSTGSRVVADGTVRLYSGGSEPEWEYEPRGAPLDGFPIDVGAERGIVTPDGEVLAIGTLLGPLGDNTMIARLADDGDLTWKITRPHVAGTSVMLGAAGSVVLAGRSFNCGFGTYLGVFKASGEIVRERAVDAPPIPWALDRNLSAVSVSVEATGVHLRTYEVNP